MNNTNSPDQIQKTADLNADLILRKYKIVKKAKFMEIKSNNPELKQSEIAKLFELSSSTIQRYRKKIYRLLLYTIPPSSKKTKKTKNTKHET